MFQYKTYGAVALIGLLAACGGGGGGGGPRTVFTYQDINSTVPGESTIAAAGLTRSDPSGRPNGSTVEIGTLEREDQVLTIAGIIANGTQNPDGSWTAGTTTVSPSTLSAFASSNFDFLLPVTVTEDGGLSSEYIIGVVSRTEDFPVTTGQVDFAGRATVGGLVGGGGAAAASQFESTGNLLLTADFNTGLVDVVIDGLTENGIPFDTVTISGLENAAGPHATFESTATSTFTFTNDGAAYDPNLGTGITQSASGAFYGGDPNGPVEAGGAFSVNGTSGDIFGIFAADERLNTP